jgi:hypothetical protein
VSGSTPVVIVTHAPEPDAHDVHGALHDAELQQKPSLQRPPWQSTLFVHAPPAATFVTQLPLASQ